MHCPELIPVDLSPHGYCILLATHFPSPALPGSGIVGMISARCFKAPLMILTQM